MCDLMSGLMLASTAMQATGSIMQGGAEARAARANAKVMDQNASLLNARINDDLRLADDEERRAGAEAAYHIGGQKVAAAAGNVDMTFGSPLRMLLASADAASRDAGTRRDNTMRGIRDTRIEQTNFRNEARQQRANAKSARQAGFLGAVGSVLGGVSGIGASRAQRGISRTFNVGRAKVVF